MDKQQVKQARDSYESKAQRRSESIKQSAFKDSSKNGHKEYSCGNVTDSSHKTRENLASLTDGSKNKAFGPKMTQGEPSKASKGQESCLMSSSINPEVGEFYTSDQTPLPSHKLNGTQGFKDGQLGDQSCAKVSSGTPSIGSNPGDLGATRCSEL